LAQVLPDRLIAGVVRGIAAVEEGGMLDYSPDQRAESFIRRAGRQWYL